MGHHRAASATGLAALALACGAGPSAAATPGTPVARCAAKDLAASVRAIDAGAGNRYAALVLTNTSRTACTTRGYVGLQLTGPDGAKVPTRVVRDTSQAAADLTVAPGGRIWARLHWGAVPSGSEPVTGPCEPTARTVRVIPPDRHDAATAPWTAGAVCAGGRIDVLPLAPGAGPSS
ncbi:DUF4232 domain-containing protein [Actinacidiphila glaucinigra]|uniref:DUF4232 domain-containing protein n=1 Tax=Actinacidiphila glaucinigra TaxID=235986 RepID=UPI0035D6C954